jgi:hypothetical protein
MFDPLQNKWVPATYDYTALPILPHIELEQVYTVKVV